MGVKSITLYTSALHLYLTKFGLAGTSTMEPNKITAAGKVERECQYKQTLGLASDVKN